MAEQAASLPKACVRRLQVEYTKLAASPERSESMPYIHAAPHPSDLLELHFVIVGVSLPAAPQTVHFDSSDISYPSPAHAVQAEDSPYSGGHYHGKLRFTNEYPYKPPAVMMLTPSGRFETNVRICLSISDFHPETWVPAWSLSCVLNGVLSFMLESTSTEGRCARVPIRGCDSRKWQQRVTLSHPAQAQCRSQLVPASTARTRESCFQSAVGSLL